MGRHANAKAKAAATLERLDRQAVTLERIDVLAQKGLRLSQAGVNYAAIAARRNDANSHAENGVQFDFNDALELLYDETFGGATTEVER
jgi:hypothetical protein